MKLSTQIRNLRKEHHLTQEDLASTLHVSRQAISNWENDKNVPDIECLIAIAKLFHVSLDTLILGEEDVEQSLIQDGSRGRQVHLSMVSNVAGALVMLMGLMCFIIKGMSIEYVDAQGFLHENFFLVPLGYFFIFIGLVIIVSQFVIMRMRGRFPGK